MYGDGNFTDGFLLGRDSNGNGNGMFGDGAWWLIIILLFGAFSGNWGNGGNNGGGSFVSGFDLGRVATTNDVASGFSTSTIMSNQRETQLALQQGFADVTATVTNSANSINQGLCTLGHNVQNGINTVSREIADCCCRTQRSIDAVNYNMATNTCNLQNTINSGVRDIIENQNNNYRALHDEIMANKLEQKNDRIAELTQQVNALNLAASQQAQNAFITANQEAQTAELIRRLGRDCPVPAYVVPNPNCCYNPYGNNGCCGNNGF